MSFKLAVYQTQSLTNAYCAGIQAVRQIDRNRISVKNPRNLTGSIDLDTTLKSNSPSAARWDYGIGYKKQQSERVYWIEVHPARTSTNLREVTMKLEFLKEWLTKEGWRLNKLKRQFIWISTGKTAFPPNSPQRRRLAQQGLRLAGAHLKIG